MKVTAHAASCKEQHKTVSNFIQSWDKLLHIGNDHWKVIIGQLFLRCTQWNEYPKEYHKSLLQNTPGLPGFVPTASQKIAAHMVLVVQKQSVITVEAPPGTGKTTMVSALAYHLVSEVKKHKQSSDAKISILVCCPSNRAADQVGRVLHQISEATREPDAEQYSKF